MIDPQALARYKPLYVLCTPAVLIMIAYLWLGSDGLQTHDKYLIGRDFVNYWTGPQAWAQGEVLDIFSIETYRQIQARLFNDTLPLHNWSYPPSMLVLLLPLAALPYLWAYAAWALGGLALYLWAAMRRPFSLTQAGFMALAPASFMTIYFGQNGFITSALFLAGLKFLATHPVLAGIMFGLLTIKPQLGILIPLALLAGREWKAILSAGVTALALAGTAALLFGVESWELYVTVTSETQMRILNEFAHSYVMMVTPFTGLRMMGLPQEAAYVLHGLFALPAALAVVWAWMRPAPDEMRHALLIVCTFLATPYAFNYDLPVMTAAVWLVACYLSQAGRPSSHHMLLAGVLSVPIFCMAFGQIGVPIAPVLFSALAIYIVREIAVMRAVPRARREYSPA